MKLKQWLYGATALAMLAACSDKDIAPENGAEDNGPGQTINGYIAVQINLPQESVGTRTEANDQFDNGTADEYKVDDAMIILFKGTDENTAKFHRAQKLTKPFTVNDDPADEIDGVTSSYLAAIEVQTSTSSTDKFWGLVMLNVGDIVSITSEEDGSPSLTFSNVKTVKTENETTTVSYEQKVMTQANSFGDFCALQTNNSFYSGFSKTTNPTKFFMTNAPLSETQGGEVTVAPTNPIIHYLTDLGHNTYTSADEARKNVSGCIFVERALAKVTYQTGTFDKNVINLKFYDKEGKEITTNVPTVDNVDITYCLTHENKNSYIIRNIGIATDELHFKWDLATYNADNQLDYRMLGNKAMPALKNPFHTDESNVKKTKLYRTYWCLDPNYDQGMGVNDKTVLEDYNEANYYNLNKALYCKENTFTVRYQNYGNSTLAIFRVNYDIKGSDGHLYIKDGDKSRIYLTEKSVMDEEYTRIYGNDNIINALKAALKDDAPTDKTYNVGNYLNITCSYTNNTVLITDISFKTPPSTDEFFDGSSKDKFDTALNNAQKESLISYVNSMHDITRYQDGVSYYVAPIKHFGDFYTPWGKKDDGSEILGTTTEAVYNEGNAWTNPSEDHAKKYLGRFGTVRNNWYDLKISKIESLGYASPTDIELKPDTSDDNKEDKKYFAVEIHVLSWAKRTQSVIF